MCGHWDTVSRENIVALSSSRVSLTDLGLAYYAPGILSRMLEMVVFDMDKHAWPQLFDFQLRFEMFLTEKHLLTSEQWAVVCRAWRLLVKAFPHDRFLSSATG
ncbi:hypothetical protein BH11ARM2_BH11ARM2_00170 [soil metagenome]